MGIAIGKASDGISRQPEATGNIRTNLMLGLVSVSYTHLDVYKRQLVLIASWISRACKISGT